MTSLCRRGHAAYIEPDVTPPQSFVINWYREPRRLAAGKDL
jgi:hypothetical protein